LTTPATLRWLCRLTAVAFFFEIIWMITQGQEAPLPAAGTGVVGSTASVGEVLFTQALLPFELTSILILAAIVGAVVLARRKSAS
jgi:NADH-quinone oxidoreductase subunit J